MAMFPIFSNKSRLSALVLMVVLALSTASLLAQSQPSGKPQQQQPSEQVPAAGGPQGDVGPVALPKKPESKPEPPPQPPKKIENMPEYSITKNVPVVNVDVLVTTKDGQFVPGLKKENFKVFEDGVAQQITAFNQAEAPITAVLLVEGGGSYYFLYDALDTAAMFTESLKKDDYVALVAFDMKPEILVDFTKDKNAIVQGLRQMQIPRFRETNLFDAVYDTVDRLEGIEGRKYIVLVSTGRDTFSKVSYDKVMKKLKETHDITIFPVAVGRALRDYLDAMCGANPRRCGYDPSVYAMRNMDFLQGDNQMKTFANLTGGRAYFPRFQGELREIFHDIGTSIHNEYLLAYHPSNSKLDGSYRKLKVELQAPDGGPLTLKDQKGKTLKYNIIAREGYTAKHVVE